MEHLDNDREVKLLEAIRKKEDEIEKSLQEARILAQNKIAKARHDAEEWLKNGEKSALDEARRFIDIQKSSANAIAHKTITESQKISDIIRREANKNAVQAIDRVITTVAPKTPMKAGILTGVAS